jgi:hypothetical protein
LKNAIHQDAAEIASKERIQAWAELEQVKQQLAAVKGAHSPRDPYPSNGKLRELQQQLSDNEAKFSHAHSENQVFLPLNIQTLNLVETVQTFISRAWQFMAK